MPRATSGSTFVLCGKLLAVATIAVLSSLGYSPVRAQSGAAPAVRVTRDLRMDSNVWPVDVNRDGITDLVSSSETTYSNGVPTGNRLQVSTGKGDGTFNAPVVSSFRGFVLGAADFNGDGNPDIVARSAPASSGESAIVIFPGNGTVTLASPVTVTTTTNDFAFAASGDLNGDGKRDLVMPGINGIDVFPGNGDFTFGPAINLTTGYGPADAILADLNGDGRRDIVTANFDGHSLSVFLNQGSFVFTGADIPIGLRRAMSRRPT